MIEDAAAIARAHVESWRANYRRIVPDAFLASLTVEERTIRWREVLISGMQVLVTEQDDQVIEFISGGPIREPLGA